MYEIGSYGDYGASLDGRLQVTMQEFEVSEFISRARDALEIFSSLHPEKQTNLHCEFKSEDLDTAFNDPDRLLQILVNLTAAFLRHTNITATVIDVSVESSQIVVVFNDPGIV
jgi:signal transduction histidine kinase